MVLLLTAVTSIGLMILAIGFIVLTLRDSGTAVLSALAGESQFIPVQSKPRVRRTVRFRTKSGSVLPQQMRAVA
jgi:hypothetical protein